MTIITGGRRSGKTTKLMELANEKGYILVEPTYRMAKFTDAVAKSKGLNIKVIPADHLMHWTEHRICYNNEKFLIDELEMFLEQIGVEGFAMSTKE